MLYRKALYIFLMVFVFSSCNDEWEEEQYENFIAFKAPLNNDGVSDIFVRYKGDQPSLFQQALVVSGSLDNGSDVLVNVALDPDTLQTLNYERFQNREDFYYKSLKSEYFNFGPNVKFVSGENTALLDIDFTFSDIDMSDKWVLPLTVLEDPNGRYRPHPRKHYKKALLRINPFNDYSGSYSGTAMKIVMEGYEDETPIVKDQVVGYVVNENEVFFYAGTIDETRQDRKNYKVFASFQEDGEVKLRSDNPEIDFVVNQKASYTISEQMDAVRPYLLRRYLTIKNIDYEFTDYTMVPNIELRYKVSGSLVLERRINTQIPDEDQAIEW